MVYLLTPLGRGGRGGSSGRGFVGNGGLWWPEGASEAGRPALLLCLLPLLASPEIVVLSLGLGWRRWWRWRGARWSEFVVGAADREGERRKLLVF